MTQTTVLECKSVPKRTVLITPATDAAEAGSLYGAVIYQKADLDNMERVLLEGQKVELRVVS